MTQTRLKIATLTTIAVLAGAGTAFAGGGEKCKDKASAALKTEAAAADQTAVLSASDTMDAKDKMTKAKKARTVLSLEDATKLCTDKGADDLQACIDYKTGVTKGYKKKTS